jgi:periplasmic nitrate reductase NapE
VYSRERSSPAPDDPDLIQIKAADDTLLIVSSGNGPDAVQVPNLKERDTALSVADDDAHGRLRRRRMEIFAFLFLTAVLMPALAVATVGSYGLAVWIYQMAAGPPGPPAR